MNEVDLVRACQKGEKRAFEDLIRMYYPYVSKFLLKVTGDRRAAEDLTQETFLKMVRNINRYVPDGKAGFGTWLITIAKNGYIDSLRKNRVRFVDIDALPLSDGSDLLDALSSKLQCNAVRAALEALPEEQGRAIRLKYEENMTLAEIAAYFNVPAKTIKSRIHEGTKKLRRMFPAANDGTEKDG